MELAPFVSRFGGGTLKGEVPALKRAHIQCRSASGPGTPNPPSYLARRAKFRVNFALAWYDLQEKHEIP